MAHYPSKKILLGLGSFIFIVILISCLSFLVYQNRKNNYEIQPQASVEKASILPVKTPLPSFVSKNKIVPQPVNIYFSKSILLPNLSLDQLSKNISLYPPIRGKWMQMDSDALQFTPETNWIPDKKYEVCFSPNLFIPNISLEKTQTVFNAPSFEGYSLSSEFYEDPMHPNIKKAVASFEFTYPITTEDKEIRNAVQVQTLKGEDINFTYRLSDANTKLHILSDPIKIKEEPDFIKIVVSKLPNAHNKVSFPKPLEQVVSVPSLSTFFNVKKIHTEIVKNPLENDRLEQILFLEFSTAVDSNSLNKYLSVYSTTQPCYKIKEKFNRKDPSLSQMRFQKLSLQNKEEKTAFSKKYAYKYELKQQNACLVIRLEAGLKSIEGFRRQKEEKIILNAANYPVEAKIALDGSLIPLQGEKTLPLVSRGLSELSVKIARIRPEDLNHLITQSNSNFTSPYFYNYNFDEENISEIFNKKISINMINPAEEYYSSLDLTQYFENKKGVFLIEVEGIENEYPRTAKDKRLIVITNLGALVKDNADNSHQLFVAHIQTGEPVKKAQVSVLGKNGLPVLTQITNDQGMVYFPSFKDFTHSQEPIAYKIIKDQDISFLPINQSDRMIDTSSFDVGGVYQVKSDKKDPTAHLRAFGFTDRGLYRPNEEVNIGVLIRQTDLNIPKKLPSKIIIYDPKGNEIAAQNVWPDQFGMLTYTFTVSSKAAVGSYKASVYLMEQQKSDKEIYSDTDIQEKKYLLTTIPFQVAEFMPDTLRIQLTVGNKKTKGWHTETSVPIHVSLNNLYGNPAQGHTVKANIMLKPTFFSFPTFKKYIFQDPFRIEKKAEKFHEKILPDTKTDLNGNADFSFNLSEFKAGTYQVNIQTEGLELGGGRGVSKGESLLVSPNTFLVGYQTQSTLNYLYKNSSSQIHLIAINPELQQIEKKDLLLTIFERKHVFNLMEMPNGTYQYQRSIQEEKISENSFSIPQEGITYALDTKKSGNFTLVLTDSNGTKLLSLPYMIAGDENTSFVPDKKTTLDIQLNKSLYQKGDSIELTVKAPYSGYGLITIEQDKVYAYKWFKTQTNTLTTSINLPKDLERNAYINVTWIRDMESPEILITPLSFGVKEFSIETAQKELNITLKAPEQVKPGQTLSITYQTPEESEIILYGVNTGILQVADYKLPRPLNLFLPKMALQVTTSQIMDLILPDMKIFRQLKGIGGDDSLKSKEDLIRFNPFARKQEKPVVFWSGILKAGKIPQTYTYQVPESFTGEIKIMAVGTSYQKFGSKAIDTKVHGDFALVVSGPVNVVPGDTFDLGVSVANMIPDCSTAIPVRIQISEENGLEIKSEKIQEVTLAPTQEKAVTFQLRSLPQLGSGSLKIKVENLQNSQQTATATYHIGIRPASTYQTHQRLGHANKTVVLKNFVQPLYGTHKEQKMIASTSPLILTQGMLPYLNHFPHFCTEQTVSKIFPAMEIFFKHPELIKDIDIYALYDDTLNKLKVRQDMYGGFRAWNNSWSTVDPFNSLYTLHFLIRAKKHDMQVPQGLLEKALEYARSQAAKIPVNEKDSHAAYAIYLLTLHGEMTTNYLLNLENALQPFKNKNTQKSLNPIYMAASYQLLQNSNKAHTLLKSYRPTTDIEEQARYLHIMGQHFPKQLKTVEKETVLKLLKPLENGNFTTRSAGLSLLALNALEEENVSENPILFNGEIKKNNGFAGMDLTDDIKQLKVTAETPFYYVISQQGYLKNPLKDSVSKGLVLIKEYLDKNGHPIGRIKVGDEITVRFHVWVSEERFISDLALTDLLPGCLEAIPNSIMTQNYDDSEIREDRVVVYFSAGSHKKEISYRAKVIASGDFTVPAAVLEALYNPLYFAQTEMQTMHIEK